MKRMLIIYSVFIFLSVLNTKIVEANEVNSIKINIDGQVSVDTQVNGVSIDYNEISLNVSNVKIEIDDNENKKLYDNLVCNYEEDHNYEYSVNVENFSENAKLIVTGEISSNELNINNEFKKEYLTNEITTSNTEYNLEITSRELKDIITYDVIFRSDDGGLLEENQYNLEYTSIMPKGEFPVLPNLVANEGYKFIGWYDEQQNTFIQNFPNSVDHDYIITAKWEKIKDNDYLTDEKNISNLETYVPSKSTKTNNIVLLIVSYIICLTTSV